MDCQPGGRRDASHLYEVEHRVQHAALGRNPLRPLELQRRFSHSNSFSRPRLQFHAQRTRKLDANGGFDLITACDRVHDFAAPHATLREIRSLLEPNEVVFAIEPKVADRLEDNINSLGAVYYGFCMTQSLAQGGPGLGTCMGPTRTEALFREAGFTRFEQLDTKNTTNLVRVHESALCQLSGARYVGKLAIFDFCAIARPIPFPAPVTNVVRARGQRDCWATPCLLVSDQI